MAGARWRPDVMCDGSTAEARATWCMENLGLSLDAAQQRVMGEFPQQFQGLVRVAGWNPVADCDGISASARSTWCVENLGLSLEDAQLRVMSEFPSMFGDGSRWDPTAQCDGHTAEERAAWCIESLGLSEAAARERVMSEFPAVFAASRGLWNPGADCDGHPAEARARWSVENLGLTQTAAQERVMSEYRHVFGSATVDRVSALGCASCAALTLIAVPLPDAERLVWSDDFDYVGPPDPARWAFDIGGDGWGNQELQHYTDRPENVWVADGVLRIRAVREDFGGNQYTSARIVTKGKADWLYGRVEVRMRLPTARGSWPAAWMLPSDAEFGAWPRSGEIDIMEHVGHDVGNVHGTVHTERFNHMKSTQVGRALPVEVGGWHTYAVDWSPLRIMFIFDGQRYHEFNKADESWEAWPFDRRFHILLNVAVGGS